jgi:hypothetical protein
MRLSRLAVCTFASDTPTTKIEVSSSGEIKSRSSKRSVNVRLLRKPISSAARGSPTALSSAWPTATEFGVPKNARANSANEPCVPLRTMAFGR